MRRVTHLSVPGFSWFKHASCCEHHLTDTAPFSTLVKISISLKKSRILTISPIILISRSVPPFCHQSDCRCTILPDIRICLTSASARNSQLQRIDASSLIIHLIHGQFYLIVWNERLTSLILRYFSMPPGPNTM